MRMKLSFALLAALFALSEAKPHPERRDLSGVEHNEDDAMRHDLRYDHDAFLGKQLAREFDLLSNADAKERLAQLFKKIDQDGDNAWSESELNRWISFVSKTAIRADANSHWKHVNKYKDEPLAWRDYLEAMYGDEDEITSDPLRKDTYVKMKRDDERRWKAADIDFDNKLNLDEYTAFLHPQEYPRMRAVVVEETLSSVDADGDGYISLDEYLADLARSYDSKYDPNAPLPEWAVKEKDQFLKHRDHNGDKRMDRDEVSEWIMPKNYDPVEAETKHLFYHADVNKDGKLVSEEVLSNQALFVGSQALNYGRPLKHEEL